MKTAGQRFFLCLLICSSILCHIFSGYNALASENTSGAGKLLFDFESEAELDDIEWQCRTFMERDAAHAVHGQYSLRVELYPDDYPGFKTRWETMSWKEFSALELTLFNPASTELLLSYRIDDRNNFPDYDERFNGSIRLRPGPNSIRLAFKDLLTSKSRRPLDPEAIFGFYLFMVRPKMKTVFYLDAIRLVP